MVEQYLVLFDADKIKDYVFATGRLKEIRGASDQVRQLTDPDALKQMYQQWFMRELTNWHPALAADTDGLIYAGGGAGALLFADESRAKNFCTNLERAFRRQTRSATLSAIAVPVPYDPSISRHQAEADAQNRAAQALAHRKAGRPQADVTPGGGVIRFCASDRLRPACVGAPAQPDDPTALLLVSQATAIKRSQSYGSREQETFLKTPFWRAFESHLRPGDVAAWRSAVRGSQDLGSIGAQSRPRGYVALVYLDGDGIGSLQRTVVQQAGFAGYAQLSRALDHAAHKATAEALAAVYRDRPPVEQRDAQTNQRRRFLPFEIITIGGDDVILICTADHGLAVACEMSRRFGDLVHADMREQPTPITLPGPVSASVGVVIAHDSLPIVQLERRGRDLLKSAKQVSTDGIGGIDFHIVSTPGLDAIATIRERDYRADEETSLTRRPYCRNEADMLLRYARHLRGLCALDGTPRQFLSAPHAAELPALPGRKRADLYRACQTNRVQATFEVLTIHARLSPCDRQALLLALADLQSVKLYPFDQADADGIHHTVLPDLLEVMEFVAEEGIWTE